MTQEWFEGPLVDPVESLSQFEIIKQRLRRLSEDYTSHLEFLQQQLHPSTLVEGETQYDFFSTFDKKL
jgi:hypothetical protein